MGVLLAPSLTTRVLVLEGVKVIGFVGLGVRVAVGGLVGQGVRVGVMVGLR